MMQPAQYRSTIDVPYPLNGARYWRILPVCTEKSNPRVVMVKSAQDGVRTWSPPNFFDQGG